MRIFDIITQKKTNLYFFSILLLLLIYIVIRLFTFESYPIFPILSYISNSYLLLIEKFTNQILTLTGSMVYIDDHEVFLNQILLDSFTPRLRFIKWMILFIFLIWVTKTTARSKVWFSFLLIIVHFLVISIYNAVGANLAGSEHPDYSYLSIPVTLGLMSLITIIIFWYRKNKVALLTSLLKFKINTRLFDNNIRVIIILYLYIIASNFLFEFFDYLPWINYLFTSAQKILAILGYDAFVEPFHLTGENGSIAMAKGCLGFQTMFLFAIIVFLTGEKNKYRWIYIILGLLFLNFVNIIRFVLLFIYIERNDDINLVMDIHDMYNYITYFIVFVLWIIWFERFADIPMKKQNKSESKE